MNCTRKVLFFLKYQFPDCPEGKTQTVERECLSYTTVWLHEGNESDRGSEGDQREERACSSTKTRGDPEKEIVNQTFNKFTGKVCLQRKKVCCFRLEAGSNFRLEAVSKMHSRNEISVQQD